MNTMRLGAALLLVSFLVAVTGYAENKYVGAKFCSACHKSGKGGTAYAVWEKTPHANAFKTLLGDEAKKIAKEKGLKAAPSEAPECLKCHVTGGGSATNVEAGFKKEEGVTCEACHGAASGWKSTHSKPENLEKAKAAGLILGSKDDAKACEKCHNPESPTAKPFVMKDMWAKIAHGKPAAK